MPLISSFFYFPCPLPFSFYKISQEMLKACEWIRRGGCSLKFKSNLNSSVNQSYPHPFVRERRDGMAFFLCVETFMRNHFSCGIWGAQKRISWRMVIWLSIQIQNPFEFGWVTNQVNPNNWRTEIWAWESFAWEKIHEKISSREFKWAQEIWVAQEI